MEGIDKEFINSLPVAVRGDILSEMQKSKDDMSDSIQKRPSSELQKLKIVQDWENFKKVSMKKLSQIDMESNFLIQCSLRLCP